ncbi:MAG: phosphoribosylamine--glycine ligase, partial [Armatimonadetes bacterium]|nr:phosphoribosylamine--glycine ligase [Armatimonadota bacterium]
HRAVDLIMRERCFGEAGARLVIEECMTGPEVSVMALVDGETVKLLPVSQDHKRALDGDAGLNTGGMGAYSPVPQIPASLIDEILATCLQPTVNALAERAAPYCGVLYGGYMLTPDGVRTLEYNCRFGDPETQAILPLLSGDFGEICHATATGRLSEVDVSWSERAAVCVVMASGGYPESYRTGLRISGLDEAAAMADVVVFHAGTKAADGDVATAGGRVLGVTGTGDSLPAAAARAYEAVARITWEDCHYRHDIAAQALRPANA